MSRFVVHWSLSAREELATLWNQARDRNRVSKAQHLIDLELEVDAESKGQPQVGPFRRLEVFPLVVLFVVHPQKSEVVVVSVLRSKFPVNGQLQRPEGTP